MALTPGVQLGPYEIVASAGAGGMGEVYRARDTRLGRTVAVKLLPASFTSDPDRLRRFEQEARAVAALEHPNILGLHDVGTHEGSPYLVSEFLEGESLRERLEAGPLPARKISDYALQIARGLAAAHEKGIVHRDLKPENIFITRDGRVKLLDFGLAKLANVEAMAAAAGPDGATAAPSDSATTPGVIMGTAGYMSPEQVRGGAVDHRSDIFSFGAVLYEMASGARAFKGETGVETMTAILKQDPPEFAPERAVPPGLERVIRRCLEKAPDQRFQSASDLAFAIEALSGTTTSTNLAVVPPASRRLQIGLVALVLLAAGAAAGVALVLALRSQPAAMHFSIQPIAEPGHMALSPDGSVFAYVATDAGTGRSQLYVQPVGGASPKPVSGSQDATYPFWSPDAKYVAFFAKGKLLKAPVDGGAAQPLASVTSPRGGAWSPRDIIVFAPDAGGSLWQVNADGSAVTKITTLEKGESSHRWPLFLPGGDQYLYYAGNFDYDPEDKQSGIYAGTLGSRERSLVVIARSNVGYADPGHLFYVVGDKLVRSRFDASNLKLAGESRVVVDKVGFQPQVYWGAFTVSRTGHLLYASTSNSAFSRLTWYDRDGRQTGELGEVATQSNPLLSPQGDMVSLDVTDFKTLNTDIWIYHLGDGSSRRFTFQPAEETTPLWSPDGNRIVFRSSLGSSNLQISPISGLETPESLVALTEGGDLLPVGWSGDGKQIIGVVQSATGADVVLFTPGSKEVVPLLASRANETHAQLSPDGRWLAYTSDESGAPEVYVTAFPSTVGKWQVSRGGGTEPRWRGDGKELFFIAADGTLHGASVATGEGAFSLGIPVPLFRILARAPVSSTDLYNYTVSRDGQRFLVNRYIPPVSIPPFNIVLNATAELQK